jgi:hypothetical protein
LYNVCRSSHSLASAKTSPFFGGIMRGIRASFFLLIALLFTPF